MGMTEDMFDEFNALRPIGLMMGSITFAPNKDDPKHCPACVVLQQEVEKLRAGNRKLMDRVNELNAKLEIYQ